ncbi:MAG: carboxyl-terminal processing protease [Salibacteraceae bacterium]|jgi:carboxyl-terminal processing protease
MKKNHRLKSSATWITSLLIITSLGFFSFQDSYFEISKNLDIFVSVYKNINTYYVDDTKPGDLMKTGIDAMLKKLDPYTVYYPESDIEDYRFMTTGQYGGIGALISRRDGFVFISEPYENFPADKAGLRAGDKILMVDGKSAEGKSTSEISSFLKGEPNTNLILTIERFGETEAKEITVTREEIKIKDVPYYGLTAENTGYIKLNGFTETASAEVKAALLDLKEKHQISNLVLDLRGNGGGLLREAVSIVGLFVPIGTKVVETKGKLTDWNHTYFTTSAPIDSSINLVVLVNGGSASASEIVSGTIQDLDRGVIIGTNTFGKGLVQQTRDLKYNSKMKLTVAKYYIPSGRCIQRLDYSHKDEDGRAIEVPDSLRKEFKTMSGRIVLDGAGIEPEVKVESPNASPILISLAQKQLIFEYATMYRNQTDSIGSAKDFVLSDEAYEDFKTFLEDKDYDYSTETEKLLIRLGKAAKSEKYADEIQQNLANLEKSIFINKSKDLDIYKKQISRYLSGEIVTRYHYQTGRIEQAMNLDEDMLEAKKILADLSLYQSYLTK